MLAPILIIGRRCSDWRQYVCGDVGWRIKAVDIPIGVAAGVGLQLGVLPLLYRPIFWAVESLGGSEINMEQLSKSAQDFVDKVGSSIGLMVLLLIAVVMAPLVEELFFRGLMQNALQKRFSAGVALLVAATIFALAHFQLLQFPGLLVVGLTCGLMVQRFKRLGPAIFCHMAFNATAVVMLL